MLRARLPLAVALLAATLVIPATAASAAGDPVTKAVPEVTTQQSPSDSSPKANPNVAPDAASPAASPSNPLPAPSTAKPNAATNPLAGTPLAGIGNTLTDPSSIPTDLQNFGTCLQKAGSNTTAGQECFETFLGDIGLPNTHCFSQNGFTLAEAQAKIEQALTGGQSELTPQAFQQNFNNLGTQLQDLVTCLTNTSAAPAASGGGGAEEATPTPSATSGEAPAATPVTGNPDFTG